MTDTPVLDAYFGPSHFAGRPDPTGTARPYYSRTERTELAERLATNMGQALPASGTVRAQFLAAAKQLQQATSDRTADHAGLLDAIDQAFAADDWLRGRATYPGAVVQPVANWWHKHRPDPDRAPIRTFDQMTAEEQAERVVLIQARHQRLTTPTPAQAAQAAYAAQVQEFLARRRTEGP